MNDRHNESTRDEKPTDHIRTALRRVVPAAVAERSISFSLFPVQTSMPQTAPIEFIVEIQNHLPVPIEVYTADRRVWTWHVDGYEEARAERRYIEDVPNRLQFNAFETKRYLETWNGHIKHEDQLNRWIPATSGTHRITAELTTYHLDRRLVDRIEVELHQEETGTRG